jgi:hypothetical protein
MAGHPARGAGAAVKKAHPVQLGFFHWVAIVQVGNFLCLASQPFRSHINIPADAPKPFNRRIPRKLFPGKILSAMSEVGSKFPRVLWWSLATQLALVALESWRTGNRA